MQLSQETLFSELIPSDIHTQNTPIFESLDILFFMGYYRRFIYVL